MIVIEPDGSTREFFNATSFTFDADGYLQLYTETTDGPVAVAAFKADGWRGVFAGILNADATPPAP